MGWKGLAGWGGRGWRDGGRAWRDGVGGGGGVNYIVRYETRIINSTTYKHQNAHILGETRFDIWRPL